MFSSSHAATEVIYRMTCRYFTLHQYCNTAFTPNTADLSYLSCFFLLSRFCDLTFQGPQSVQEDWIKHLQRHLMHTSIPGMGTGMVEVSAMCKELCSPTPPERLLLDTHPPLSLPEGVS